MKKSTNKKSKRDLEVEIVHRPTKDATASPKAKAKPTAKNLPAKVESHLAKKGLDASTLNSAARDLYRKIRDDDTASLHLKELANMLRINARLIRDLSAALDQKLETRGVYALSTIMSQQREVIADIRAVTDQSQQIELISTKILQPAATNQAQVLTSMFYQLRRLITETSNPKQAQFALRQLENVMADIARDTQTTFESVSAKISDVLSAATK